MKLRKCKKHNYYFLTIFSILFLSYLLVDKIGSNVTTYLPDIIGEEVNHQVYLYIFNIFDKETISNDDLLNIVIINKNDEGEILTIDYNIPKVYSYLSDSMSNFFNDVDSINLENSYLKKYKNIYFVPSGINKNNIIFSHLGIYIPCYIELFSNVDMGFKTKVTNYGINSLLTELYLSVDVENKILLIDSNSYKEHYDILLTSKIINGSIPSYYGGQLEKSSVILSS